ncbi:transposase domain protein [Slackia sp. CM382]|nr:transposase domain protein [Slackia sp. CM382]
MGNPSPRYTAEFKQKAVELYRKSGTTYAEVACGLGLRRGQPGRLGQEGRRGRAGV